MPEAPPTPWAQWLDRALKRRGWSAPDLARTGVVASDSTVYKWLRGDNPPKLPDTVIEIAHKLGEPNAIEALEAAGMHRVADLIQQQIADAGADPMIARIRAADLAPEERDAMVEGYRRAQENTTHYFELQLAEAARRRRTERDRRTRRTESTQRAAQ